MVVLPGILITQTVMILKEMYHPKAINLIFNLMLLTKQTIKKSHAINPQAQPVPVCMYDLFKQDLICQINRPYMSICQRRRHLL